VSETKIANPGPLGLSGFALTTLLLSLVNAGIINATKDVPSAVGAVLASALFYGGTAQLLAGMWEFRTGNTFGAYAFTSYGAFWLSIAASAIFPAFGFLGDPTAKGYFLLGWTIVTAILTIASFRTNGATVAVFVLLLITFILLTVGTLGDNTSIYQIGGYFGIATAIAAWYTALAGVLTATSGGKMNLPVFPLA